MRKILISLVMLSSLVFSDSATQSTLKVNGENQEVCQKELKIENVKRSGCCSWHDGIAGCSDGRVVCNDGTYSPSCTCNSSINPLG